MSEPKRNWALVLGASSGFGEAVSVALAKAGRNIFGVHLDRRATLPNAERIVAEIEAAGGRAIFWNVNAADAARRAEVIAGMKEAIAAAPGESVDVVLHSLAFGTLKPFLGDEKERMTQAQMDMTLDVMAHSLVYWTQDLVAAGLLGAGAHVFAMTSAGGHRIWQSYGAVSAAKAALESHCRQLAVELVPKGIAVNAIRAGVTDTPALRKIPGNVQMIDRVLAVHPAGRLTTPQDVANVIVAIARPETVWLTGNVLGVDGTEDLIGVIALPAGSFALVTGASGGIGEAIARGLARRKVPQLLVARSGDKLAALADELRTLSGVAVEAIVLDLASEGAAERLAAATEGAGKQVGLLVNNAAFGFYGPDEEQELERKLRMLKLNVETLVDLTHRLLAPMRARGGGYVLNVASTAAFLPVPYMAVYAATKAFVLSYSQALHEELLGRGVVVTALCPGTTRTDFHRVAGLAPGASNPFPSLSAETVAEAGLRGLERGKAIVVPNLLDSAWIFTGRFVPRTLPPRIGAAVFSRLKRSSPV